MTSFFNPDTGEIAEPKWLAKFPFLFPVGSSTQRKTGKAPVRDSWHQFTPLYDYTSIINSSPTAIERPHTESGEKLHTLIRVVARRGLKNEFSAGKGLFVCCWAVPIYLELKKNALHLQSISTVHVALKCCRSAESSFLFSQVTTFYLTGREEVGGGGLNLLLCQSDYDLRKGNFSKVGQKNVKMELCVYVPLKCTAPFYSIC